MKILNAFLIAVVLLSVATLTYWVQDRTSPVMIAEERVETPLVPRGGQLRVKYIIERKKACHVVLEQMLFDSRRGRFILDDQEYLSEPLGRDEFSVVIETPSQMTEGPARYRASRSYFCNPMHRALNWPITVTQDDVGFEVVE